MAKKTFPTPFFSSVVLAAPFDFTLTSGPDVVVSAQGEAEVLDKLDVQVANNTLYVKKSGMVVTGGTRITVQIPRVTSLTLQAASKVEVSKLSVPEFSLASTSPSDVILSDCEFATFQVQLGGSEKIRASGRGTLIDVQIEKSADLDASNYLVSRAKVVIEDTGRASVSAKDDLNVVIKKAGRVTYRGEPKLTSSVSVAGELRKA